LQLDGELSELERLMMESHFGRCPECRAFERDAAGLTQLLRDAPIERLPYPLVVRRPRRVSVARMQVGFAAALAVAVLGVAVQLTGSEPQRSSTLPSLEEPVQFETASQLAREVEQILAYQRAYDRRPNSQGPAVPI
jgi:predicted anti-sigma-YlaC factor YlaD